MNRAPPPNAAEITFAEMNSAGMRGVLTTLRDPLFERQDIFSKVRDVCAT